MSHALATFADISNLPFDGLDLAILIVSVLLVSAYGMYMGRKEEGAGDFYLAGKSVPWWAVAGSIFGTNISSHHLVGMMGAGLALGFAQANYEFGAICGLLMLCYFFLPLYRRMGVYTLSEYLGKRFDDRSRMLYSATNLGFLLVQLCGTLLLGGITVEALLADTEFAISSFAAIVGLAVVATVYTVFGGLKAVIYTDVIQSGLLLVGAAIIAVMALSHPAVGGISGLLEKDSERFHIFFASDHPELPWTGVMTGLMLQHFYYWGTNQFMVQRALGAKTGWDGRMGIIVAGFLKLSIPFISIVPGMAAAHIVSIDPEATDTAFARLTRELLTPGYGLVGLVMAGLVGAILSTIDSMMNSAATLFTFDFYKKYLRTEAKDRELIAVGRIAMIALMVVTCVLLFFFSHSKENVFNQMVDYVGYLVPGMMIVFLLGIFWRGATPTAACVGIIAGPIVSVGFERGAAEYWEKNLQSFHRVALAGVACLAIVMIVSWATQYERSPEREQYVWRQFRRQGDDGDSDPRPWFLRDGLWACLLALVTLGLVFYFA